MVGTKRLIIDLVQLWWFISFISAANFRLLILTKDNKYQEHEIKMNGFSIVAQVAKQECSTAKTVPKSTATKNAMEHLS